MHLLITGGAGFLGWHLRARLRATTDHTYTVVDQTNWGALDDEISRAAVVIHLAGINRAAETELIQGNIALAQQVVAAAQKARVHPRIVYSNSIQAGNGTPYGAGKQRAAEVFAVAAAQWRTPFVDILLPNLFGEHGRPGYNSFVATFVARVVEEDTPSIDDRPINLLHAQQAAQVIIDALDGPSRTEQPEGTATSVQTVWDDLRRFHETYSHTGEIPALNSPFEVALFNSYRAALFPGHYPINLTRHSDERGWLVEVARWTSGQGQTFVSSTNPGFTRGEHYHLRKIERFVVVRGQARIALRKVDTDEIVTFDVTGDEPQIVDMPIGWIHNITNTGDSEVITQFWVNETFNPDDPDTFWEPVKRPSPLTGAPRAAGTRPDTSKA